MLAARAWRRCCGTALLAWVGVIGCTEDGIDPGDTDAASAPVDGLRPSDTGAMETGTMQPDGGSVDGLTFDASFADDANGDGNAEPRVDAGEPPIADGGSLPPVDPQCDLRGRWLVSQRYVAEAVSERQGSHSWFYFEVRQEGGALTVQKGLHCGYA